MRHLGARSLRSAVVLALAAVCLASAAAAPAVSRGLIAHLERQFDKRIRAYNVNDPFHLLGTTRGVYLDRYGVVFTSEVNLVAAAVVTPFRPAFTDEQIEQLHQKKLQRLDDLKQMMRDMMVDSATTLDAVPPEQRIAVGVSLFRFSWENSKGIPEQILMEATRQSLVDYETGRLDQAGLDAAIQVREF